MNYKKFPQLWKFYATNFVSQNCDQWRHVDIGSQFE